MAVAACFGAGETVSAAVVADTEVVVVDTEEGDVAVSEAALEGCAAVLVVTAVAGGQTSAWPDCRFTSHCRNCPSNACRASARLRDFTSVSVGTCN